MTKAVTPHRWLQGWRAAKPSAQPDPADLGTAWGLDQSMGNTPAEAPKASEARRPGWVRRLSTRRKPRT